MNAKRFLYQYEKMQALIEAKELKILELKEKATKSTVQDFAERVQVSVTNDPVGVVVACYTDLERELEMDIIECRKRQAEIERVLACLPTAEFRVLHKRFIEGKELYIVADEMSRSYSWANKKQRLALKHVQEILDEREKR